MVVDADTLFRAIVSDGQLTDTLVVTVNINLTVAAKSIKMLLLKQQKVTTKVVLPDMERIRKARHV